MRSVRFEILPDVGGIPVGPHRQPGDFRSRRFGRDADFVSPLQIEPELRIDAEPMAAAQSGVARYRALAGDDLADPVRRHGDLSCELGRRDVQLFPFAPQHDAGMNGSHEHALTPHSQ